MTVKKTSLYTGLLKKRVVFIRISTLNANFTLKIETERTLGMNETT